MLLTKLIDNFFKAVIILFAVVIATSCEKNELPTPNHKEMLIGKVFSADWIYDDFSTGESGNRLDPHTDSTYAVFNDSAMHLVQMTYYPNDPILWGLNNHKVFELEFTGNTLTGFSFNNRSDYEVVEVAENLLVVEGRDTADNQFQVHTFILTEYE